MSVRRGQSFRQFPCLILWLSALLLFVTGCSLKKPSLAGSYQGTWKTEKHQGLLKFAVGPDRSLIGEINMDDTSNTPLYLYGPIEDDGSFSLKIGDKIQLIGSMELSESGMIKGSGLIKPSRHNIDFTLRRVISDGSPDNNAPVVQIAQEVPQQAQVQAQSPPTASTQYTQPAAEARKPIYYAALITRTSDTKQAYVLWSKRRDGSQEDFQNKIMRDTLPQFSSGNHPHCEVTFMTSDQLPSTAVELREIESVGSFANP